jgi:DedD protein
MAVAEDTEITLGTGKMLALFFGLVALCAVFFGMGFSLGKNSARPNGDVAATSAASVRPTAVKAAEARAPSDLTFYKAVEQKESNAELTAKSAEPPADTAVKAAPADNDAPPDPSAVASTPSNYFVQVAAVSKEEDASALVDALKKKQYAAFAANTPADKLFHVQVGPFSDIKDAEIARGQLVKDGYNPILKK